MVRQIHLFQSVIRQKFQVCLTILVTSVVYGKRKIYISVPNLLLIPEVSKFCLPIQTDRGGYGKKKHQLFY